MTCTGTDNGTNLTNSSNQDQPLTDICWQVMMIMVVMMTMMIMMIMMMTREAQ